MDDLDKKAKVYFDFGAKSVWLIEPFVVALASQGKKVFEGEIEDQGIKVHHSEIFK